MKLVRYFCVICVVFFCGKIKAFENVENDFSLRVDNSLSLDSKINEIINRAYDTLGIKYKRSSSSLSNGFDCSGLIHYLYSRYVPNIARSASNLAKSVIKIDKNELRPGDLIFYNTNKKINSHVVLYIGDNKFIHAPSAGKNVMIEDMNQSYWLDKLNGFGRINL